MLCLNRAHGRVLYEIHIRKKTGISQVFAGDMKVLKNTFFC